jgi:nucleotide-binding universal stress UspA family protein
MAFTHVLVPTDFSDPASRALRYAAEEAALHRAKVTLLHVLPTHAGTDVYHVGGAPETTRHTGYDPLAGARVGGPPFSEPTVVRRDPGEAALSRLRDLVPDTRREAWAVETASGPPADTIVRIAEERGVDLIVMGTHGRTGLQHMLLGSVAEKVVRTAPCPVLTVRHESVA